MNSETRQCQNCKKEFIIEPDDFAFYEKMKVPAPTFCPECRAIRRRVWRNERSLHKRTCDLCKKDIIAMYPADTPFPVYCNECWYSDKWDTFHFGQEYDFSRSFFSQFHDLQNQVPRMNLTVINNTQCFYVNYTWHSNRCYMCWDLGYGENCLYCDACHFIKDSLDNLYCKKLELCYDCVDSRESTRSEVLEKCENCLDSHFLWDCRGCSSCILCTNLRNKSYHILNKPYTKEQYLVEKKRYLDGSFANLEKTKSLFDEIKKKAIRKENNNIQAVRCTGDNIWNSKNCRNSFNVFRSQDCAYVNDIDSDLKDSMDLCNAAEGEALYEGTSMSGSNLLFGVVVAGSIDVSYSSNCARNNKHLFGCVGVNDKSYCILNKQYTKEEYEALVPKIIAHMNEMPHLDAQGHIYKYGEFFPIEHSVFPYNEAKSQEYHQLTKEEALQKGYKWRDKEERHYNVTIKQNDVPDNIKDVPDSIINEVIECAHKGECSHQCSGAFKITQDELRLYKVLNVPLPRLCPNCRYFERTLRRNPMRLWDRQCAKCGKEIKTSYAPDRPEIIYCEQCYNQEVA